MVTSLTQLVHQAAARQLEAFFTKFPHPEATFTVKELVKRVAAETGVAASTTRSLVSLWIQEQEDKYHVASGPKGGIRQGAASDAPAKEGKGDCCPLCDTGLRSGRAAALMDLFNKYPAVRAVIDASGPDLKKDLARLVKAHAKEDEQKPTPPPAPNLDTTTEGEKGDENPSDEETPPESGEQETVEPAAGL